MRYPFLLSLLTGLVLLASCSAAPDFTPKPKGYNRINLPPHSYRELAGNRPYSFEYSKEAVIKRDSSYLAQPNWINV